MPVLPSIYLGSLQKINFGSKSYILEKFSQTQLNQLSDKQMIQGSLGVKVMDVGEIYWKTTIDSTALVYENGVNGDVFSLISLLWDNIRSANNETITPYQPLLEKATISIDKNGVRCSTTLKSDGPSYFSVTTGNATEPIARTAKWFDCSLLINSNGPIGFGGTSEVVALESAEIVLDAKISQRYFVGQGQTPYFSIDSYNVSGRMTVLASPQHMFNANNYIESQNRGQLVRTGSNGLTLFIGNIPLYIGLAAMNSEYTRTVQAGDVNKITISFTSYTS
jgi:hypothetical protein